MFRIQVCNPTISGKFDKEDTSLSEAMETVYPLKTECAIMFWNYTSIPLSYKYDIAYLVPGILSLFMEMENVVKGEKLLVFPSSTFNCEWHVKWENDVLKIDSKWSSVQGEIEGILNSNSVLTVSKNTFESEWKHLLIEVNESLRKSGYLSDKFEFTQSIQGRIVRIADSGYLY